jgi:hypothetical protein
MGDPAVAGGASDGVPGAAAVGAPGGSAGDDFAGPEGVCGADVAGGVLSGPRLHAGVRESDATRKDAVTTE